MTIANNWTSFTTNLMLSVCVLLLEEIFSEGILFILAASVKCVFSPVSGRWFNVAPMLSFTYPIDNTEINIRAGGKLFPFGKKSVCTSVTDLRPEEEILNGLSSNSCGQKSKSEGRKRGQPRDRKKETNILEPMVEEFETYSSHENLHRLTKAREKKSNGIDERLIRCGLNDNSTGDPNTNGEIRNGNQTSTKVGHPGLVMTNGESRKQRQSFRERKGESDKSQPMSLEDPVLGNAQFIVQSKSTNTPCDYSLRKSKSAPNPFRNARLRRQLGKLDGPVLPSSISACHQDDTEQDLITCAWILADEMNFVVVVVLRRSMLRMVLITTPIPLDPQLFKKELDFVVDGCVCRGIV